MATITSVKVSDLQKIRRIDAEFFKTEYIELENKLLNGSVESLDDIAYVTDGDHGSPDFDDSSEIIYLSAKTVKDNFFLLSNAERISSEQHNRNKRSSLEVGDIVISTVGTIGNVAVVTENMIPGNMDRHVGLVRLHDKSGDRPYFFAAFLNSSLGRYQSLRHSTGNVQLNLFISKMNEFIVPKWSKEFESIASQCKKSYDLRLEAEKLINQADEIFANDVGLSEVVSNSIAYRTNQSELIKKLRFDAEYYQPIHNQIEDKITSNPRGWGYLDELMYVSDGKVKPENDSLYHYIELSDVDSLIGTVESSTELTGDILPSRARMKVENSDVLLSSIEGSMDRVALLDLESENMVASTGFYVIKPQKFSPEVNLIILRSKLIQLLLKREAQGTILTAVPRKSLSRVMIPIVNEDKHKQITELVQESHSKLKLSKSLSSKSKLEIEKIFA